jgi:hypothetical protein
MPRKRRTKSKLDLLADQIAEARCIVAARQILLEKLRVEGHPAQEVEGALRTYASSLMHLLAHEHRLKEEAAAKKGETKLKGGHPKAVVALTFF